MKSLFKNKKLLDWLFRISREDSLLIFILVICLSKFAYEVRFIATAFSDLRPIADDYCHAQEGWRSLVGNVSYWFNTWTGDLSVIVVSYFLLALPIANLPLGLGSFIPFLLTIVVLAFAINSLLFKKSKEIYTYPKLFIKLLLIVSFCLSTWLTYWFLPTIDLFASPNQIQVSKQFFGSMLNWQTVNVSYVLIPLAGLLIINWFQNSRLNGKLFFLLIALAGLFIGFAGYVTAVTLIGFVFAELLFGGQKFNKRMFKTFIVFVSFSTLAIIASLTSPGAQARKAYLTSEYDFGMFFRILNDSIYGFFEMLVSFSSVYVLVMGFTLAFLINKIGIKFESMSQKLEVSRLFFLSYLTFLVAKYSEVFSYPAFWHEVSARSFLFVTLLVAGVYLFHERSSKVLKIYKPILVLIIFCPLLLSVYSVNKSSEAIEMREAIWKSSPAPVEGGVPADREIEWINKCWLNSKNMSQYY